MKKLALAAAIASSLATGSAYVHAKTYSISSNITGSQLFLGSDAELINTMTIGGTININTAGGASDAWTVDTDQSNHAATLTGSQVVQIGAPSTVEVIYNLTGTSHAGGIVFNDGIIDTPVDGVPYSTIDASATNLHFDNTHDWFGMPLGGIDMSGGQVNGDGTITITFNGLWTGTQPIQFVDVEAAAAQASSAVTLFGNAAVIFLEGELTLSEVSEVPVPAAAWLFGSALIGLAGIKRKK